MRNRWIGLVASILLLTAVDGFAQEFSGGARPAGMGDAFTAIAVGPAAIYHNPAGTARAVTYAVEGLYEYTPTGNVLNVSVVDSKTNTKVAAGLGYSYYFARDTDRTGHDIRLGLGFPVVPDRISIGIGGRWVIVNDRQEVTDPNTNEVSEQDVKLMGGPTIDAGAMFKVSPNFEIGVAAKNLIDQCDRVECEAIAPTIVQGGFAFSSDIGFVLSVDGGVDLTSGEEVGFDAGVGAEYLVSGIVPIRVGYERFGVAEQNWLSFGAGWRSNAAGVDAGYQLNLDDTDSQHFMGSLSVYF